MRPLLFSKGNPLAREQDRAIVAASMKPPLLSEGISRFRKYPVFSELP